MELNQTVPLLKYGFLTIKLKMIHKNQKSRNSLSFSPEEVPSLLREEFTPSPLRRGLGRGQFILTLPSVRVGAVYPELTARGVHLRPSINI